MSAYAIRAGLPVAAGYNFVHPLSAYFRIFHHG
jgi:hypothetical protein